MNEKIKKVALNLEELITEYDTPQNVYDKLIDMSNKQEDYFKLLGPENIIKLTFLIYSHKKTNSFELGEKMLNDSMFLTVIFSEGNEYRTICDACMGDAEVNCSECDGTNEVNCDECEGTGEIPCDTCDGSGIDPYSEDEEECSDCNGAGNRTCWNCGGNETTDCLECSQGLVNCPQCDGIGELETDDWIYEAESILTWNKKIIANASETKNTLVPLMSFEQYQESYTEYIVMHYYGDLNLEFKKGFRANEVYCLDYDDNPTLTFKNHRIQVFVPWRNLTNYGN